MAVLAVTNTYMLLSPMWVLMLLVLYPVIHIALRSMNSLNPLRKYLAIITRCLLVIILTLLLARLTNVEESEEITTVVVVDRSQSIPKDLLEDSLNYIEEALKYKPETAHLAVVDIAELASISKLSSKDTEIRRRNTAINGSESRLSDGIQMALAIAPPETASRILLVSDGNQTEGDLIGAAEVASMNNVPVDVLPIRYEYSNEVIFKRLTAPVKAKSNQTISLRFVLHSTAQSTGKIYLSLNGKPVDLDSDSTDVAAGITLKPGTNVQTLSLPVGSRGVHEFNAVYVPDDKELDQIEDNNRTSAITYVSGPGRIMIVGSDLQSASTLLDLLESSELHCDYIDAAQFPDNISRLIDVDAVVLSNTSCSNFSYQQQELLTRYVTDLGGGLVMTGGPEAFGAGGWIGSPVQDILPVDLDPPQKKQLPKGALVLIMHSCEMPQGNLWGERVAIAAVNTLSRLDLVGVMAYDWEGKNNWVYPLSEAGDKSELISSIKKMQVGDMPDLGSHIQAAYEALETCDAAQKHIIVISDGDPAPPTKELLSTMKDSGISCTGVAVFPHSPQDVKSLMYIAQSTGGRFYDVKDPQQLPKIFIKEAQEVKRSLIREHQFVPQITFSIDEILKGINVPLPPLNGLVLTGAKGGLNKVIMTNEEGDPLLASCQAGLGRCVVFTSSLDTRWASQWVSWDSGPLFVEQLMRWAAKPATQSDCEVAVDVQGRVVTFYVESLDADGEYVGLADIKSSVISPDISSKELVLEQVGPGQYKGKYPVTSPGSHLLNLRYSKTGGSGRDILMQTPFTVPYAPEYNDLTDNIALLEQVCEATGGRLIDTAPREADIFNDTGVSFPKTYIPLTDKLILIWLGVFLFDVAVRRVVFDFKLWFKKLIALTGRNTKGENSQNTLHNLKKRQKKLHKELYRTDAAQTRRNRYEASEKSQQELPLEESSSVNKQKKADIKTQDQKATSKKVTENSHIQQLLKAKKKASEKNRE